MKKRKLFLFALLAAFGSLFGTLSLAQTYPNRLITIIVCYPPGGGTDTIARPLARKMSEITGQTVVVLNKAGGRTMIGMDAVAKAPPDGYTIAIMDDTFSINPLFSPKPPYDSARDFVPLAGLLTSPMVLVVPPKFPANTVSEFVALAKSKPGELNYASLGPTDGHALAMQWLNHLAGIKMTAVSYRGLAPAMLSVTTNETQALMAGLAASLAQMKGGNLKALAVTSAKRTDVIPTVPAIAETYPQFNMPTWFGAVVPAGTPPDVVSKLNAIIVKALNSPELRKFYASLNVDVWATSPAEFSEFLQQNQQMWADIIKVTGTNVAQ